LELFHFCHKSVSVHNAPDYLGSSASSAQVQAIFFNAQNGKSDRKEQERFRCFRREEIAKRGENLDISWLRDDSLQSIEDLPEPDAIANDILAKLRTAIAEMEALRDLLN